MTERHTVDCRGLSCPQPMIATKEALETDPGPLVVIVSSANARADVTRLAESRGCRVSVETRGDDHWLSIQPDAGPAGETPPVERAEPRVKSLVVFVSSEGFGRGDEELGEILMAAFLDTLSQFKDEVSHVIFVNAGAKLAVLGSPVLEQLQQLEQLGAEVLVCGTCLNHFGITDQLAVGSVSNMYAIIETLSQAKRIIRP